MADQSEEEHGLAASSISEAFEIITVIWPTLEMLNVFRPFTRHQRNYAGAVHFLFTNMVIAIGCASIASPSEKELPAPLFLSATSAEWIGKWYPGLTVEDWNDTFSKVIVFPASLTFGYLTYRLALRRFGRMQQWSTFDLRMVRSQIIALTCYMVGCLLFAASIASIASPFKALTGAYQLDDLLRWRTYIDIYLRVYQKFPWSLIVLFPICVFMAIGFRSQRVIYDLFNVDNYRRSGLNRYVYVPALGLFAIFMYVIVWVSDSLSF